MNYIALLNRYWQLHKQQGFAAGDSHLYGCLLHEFSSKGVKSDWPETQQWTDGSLAGLASVDVKTIKPARERLEARGLIQVTSKGQGARDGRVYRLAPEDQLFALTSPSTSPKNGEVDAVDDGLTSPKNGEVSGQLLQEHPQQHTQKTEMLTEKSLIYKEIQTRNSETQTLKKNKEGDEFLNLDGLPNENLNTPNPVARPPSPEQTDDGLSDADRAELERYTKKLQSDTRLLYKLSSLDKLKGDSALEWIAAFVLDQWSAKNLTTRNDTELILHCQRWIAEQLEKLNGREQRNHRISSSTGKPRTKGTLRPTALGQPDYRGEGSACDVEL